VLVVLVQNFETSTIVQDGRAITVALTQTRLTNHTALARQILEECNRVFRQVGDHSTQKVQVVIKTVDEQFHPGETAMQVYVRLLNSNANRPNI
jgi:predicted nucleic acid-binding protein